MTQQMYNTVLTLVSGPSLYMLTLLSLAHDSFLLSSGLNHDRPDSGQYSSVYMYMYIIIYYTIIIYCRDRVPPKIFSSYKGEARVGQNVNYMHCKGE